MRMRIPKAIFLLAFLTSSAFGQNPGPAVAKEVISVSTYLSPKATQLTADDLKAMPHITVTVHNSHTNLDEIYSGVRLADILARFKAPLGNDLHGHALANYVVSTGFDGYQAVLSLGEVDPSFHPGEVIVADAMNGKPLDAHNGPFKLIVGEDKRPARSVRNLTTIELKVVP